MSEQRIFGVRSTAAPPRNGFNRHGVLAGDDSVHEMSNRLCYTNPYDTHGANDVVSRQFRWICDDPLLLFFITVPWLRYALAPSEYTCNSYVDASTGASLCPNGFRAVTDGGTVSCGTEADACDDGTCCEEGECVCILPVALGAGQQGQGLEIQCPPSDKGQRRGVKHHFLVSSRCTYSARYGGIATANDNMFVLDQYSIPYLLSKTEQPDPLASIVATACLVSLSSFTPLYHGVE